MKNQKRSNGNTLRRSRRSGRSKSIPESIIPVTIFRAFARRLPWSSRIFTKMAATSELNSSLFMEEVQKYECLYNKFSKDYKNKFTRLNCWRKIGEKFDVDAAEAEKKYKNIRTAYGRYLKVLRQSSAVGPRNFADDRELPLFGTIEAIIWKPAIAPIVPIVSIVSKIF